MRWLLGLLFLLSSGATPLQMHGRLLAVSPDGQRFALVDGDAVAFYQDGVPLVRLPRMLLDPNALPPQITFSDDGSVVTVTETLGSGGRWATTVYALDDDELLYLGPEEQVVLSPDGSAYASLTNDGTVTLYGRASGEALASWEYGRVWDPPVFAAGGMLLVVSLPGEPSIRIIHTATGDEYWRFDQHTAVLSPDGTRLLLRDEDNLTWEIYDLLTLSTVLTGSIRDHDVDRWTANSAYVYGLNYMQTVMLDAATGDVAFVSATDGNVSPDGATVAAIARSSDGSPSRLKVVNVASGDVRYEGEFDGISSYFSDDGRYLVLPQYETNDLPRRTDVIDVEAGELLYTLPFLVDRVMFSGDWMAVDSSAFAGLMDARTGEMLAAGNGVVFYEDRAYVSYGWHVEQFTSESSPLRPIVRFEHGTVTDLVDTPVLGNRDLIATLYDANYCGLVDRYTDGWLWVSCAGVHGWTQSVPAELICPQGVCDVQYAPNWQF